MAHVTRSKIIVYGQRLAPCPHISGHVVSQDLAFCTEIPSSTPRSQRSMPDSLTHTNANKFVGVACGVDK